LERRNETAEEWLLLIKTERNLYPELEEEIKKAHKYETPEIIALPITTGSKDYLGWLDKELK